MSTTTTTLPPPRLYNPSTDLHHLDAIAQLHASCITTDHTLVTFLPPLSHAKILASWTSWSEQVTTGHRVIILQLSADESELAGVVSLFMPETETGKHRSEVGRLLVSTGFRKRGIARVLMGSLEEVARERGRWMVVSLWSWWFMLYMMADSSTASRHHHRQRSRARVPKIGLQGNWHRARIRIQSQRRQSRR
jgi:GNAT superfamily N-acetyltransferase